MPRARNIKPGIIQNDELAALDKLARIAFPHMWMLADFNGNIEYKPAKLKVQILPYDDVDIEFVLTELERGGFVKRYDENGSHYLHICKFSKHQNPHKNEILRGTNIPTIEEVEARKGAEGKPEEKQELDQGTDQAEIKTEQGQYENGSRPADSLIPDSGSLTPDTKQQGSASSDASPDDPEDPPPVREFPTKDGATFTATEQFVEELKSTYPRIDVEYQLKKARLWLIANPDRKKTPRGMTRFLNNWMSNQKPMAEIHPMHGRHTGFNERDYSEGLLKEVSDGRPNF